MNKRRKIILGLSSSTALAVWHKPVVKSIMTPAHAQTSPPPPSPPPPPPPPAPPPPPPPPAPPPPPPPPAPPPPPPPPAPPPPPPPTPAELCAMITIGNVTTGPVSGSNTPPVCTATFDVLSADAANSLTITSIDAGALPANVTLDIQALGTATDSMGPRVTWRGPATDAPFCTNLMPIDEVTITVTATCAAVTDGGTFTQQFTLSQILALCCWTCVQGDSLHCKSVLFFTP